MGITGRVVLILIVSCLGIVILAKVTTAAVAFLIQSLPSLIALWFIVMILRGMVRRFLRSPCHPD